MRFEAIVFAVCCASVVEAMPISNGVNIVTDLPDESTDSDDSDEYPNLPKDKPITKNATIAQPPSYSNISSFNSTPLSYKPIQFSVDGHNISHTVNSASLMKFLTENDQDSQSVGGSQVTAGIAGTAATASSSSDSSTHTSVLSSLWDKLKNIFKRDFDEEDLDKRSIFEVISITNQKTYYSLPVMLGSQRAQTTVLLDTGSSDLWVPDTDSKLKTNYDPKKSASFMNTTKDFSIRYGDGTYAKGDWAQDTVTVGDIKLDSAQFGVCDNVTAGQGILGVGLVGNEAASQKYANIPYLMKLKGYLKTVSYSLYLDSSSSKSGSFLVGAIDKAKFDGDLVRLPLVNVDDNARPVAKPVAFFVNITSISGSHDGVETFTNSSAPALLDSGTTLTFAPEDVYDKINKKYGHHFPGLGYINKCKSHAGENLTFSFGQNVSVTVPVSQIMYPLTYSSSGKPVRSPIKHDPYCLVGVSKSSTNQYILGDNFLRSAYVHFDLTGNTVGLAQVKYTQEQNIVPYKP